MINSIQPIIAIGGLVFGMGSIYAQVQDVKGKVDKVEIVTSQQAEMTAEIGVLHEQIRHSSETQAVTNQAVGKLADAVSSLSNSVARLEGRLDTDNKKHR